MALTKQQQVFAANVVQGMTLADAAIGAGYSKKSAISYSSQLMDNPKVVSEIERMRAKAEIISLGSKAELLNMVWQRLQACQSDRDFSTLSRLWFDASGSMVHKQEITTAQAIDLVWAAPVGDDTEDEDAG